MKIKFSIITASKNAKNDFCITVDSLLHQSDNNYEFILIDNVSDDGTIEFIETRSKEFAYSPIIVSEPDKGIYDAFNKGLKLASGEYICYLGCGDKLTPNALEIVKKKITTEPGADVYYGILKKYYNNGGFTIYSSSPENLFNCSMIPHQASFIKRDTYLKLGGFSLEYKIASDFEVMLRILLNNGKFVFIDQILAEFKMGGISTRDSDGFYECMSILKKYGCVDEKEYNKKILKKRLRDIVNRIL